MKKVPLLLVAVLILTIHLMHLAWSSGNTGSSLDGTPDNGGSGSGTASQSTFCTPSGKNCVGITGVSLCTQTSPQGASMPNAIDAGICACPADFINARSGGSSSSLIPDNGEQCHYYNESVIVTYYPSAGNAGLLNQLGGQNFMNNIFGSQSLSVPVPIISAILSYNNAESPSLITCPAPVDFTNTTEYFYKQGTFMGGNRCLQNSLPLITPVHYNNQINFASKPYFMSGIHGSRPVTDSASYEINCNLIPSAGAQQCGSGLSSSSFSSLITGILNPLLNSWMSSLAGSSSASLLAIGLANGTVNTLAFSGETTLSNPTSKSLSQYNISSSYNTQSYIFQNINGTPQQALWTWSAKYANLASTDLGYLNIDKTVNNLHSLYGGIDFVYCQVGYVPTPPVPVQYVCDMKYSYTLHSYVSTLQNSQIEIPAFNATANNPSGKSNLDFLDVGNYKYNGKYMTSLSGVSGSCQTQMLQGGPGCDGWIKISINGTYITSRTNLGGKIFEDLPVYAKAVSGAPRGASGILDYKLYSTDLNPECGGPTSPLPPTVNNYVPLPTSVVQLYTVQGNGDALVVAVYKILEEYNPGWLYSNCYNGNWFWGLSWKYEAYNKQTGGYVSGWIQIQPQHLPIVDYVAPAGLSAQQNGAGQGFVFAQGNSSGITFNSVGIAPVLVDNFGLPTPYTQGSVPGYTNSTYEIYSPNNFAGASGLMYPSAPTISNCGSCVVTPTGHQSQVWPQATGVEPFDLYTGGGFLATYSTKDNTAGNLVAFGTSNFNSPLIYPGYLDHFLMIYGGESAGDSSLSVLQSVPAVSYLTSAPDGSIYAIEMFNSGSIAPSFNWLQINPLTSLTGAIVSIFSTQSTTVTNSLLVKLNYVPTGVLLSPGPGTISPQESGNPSAASSAQLYNTWNAMSRYYFEESLLYHTPQLAITGFTVLSTTTTSQSLWGNIFGSNPAATAIQGTTSQKITLGKPFIALGAVTDTAGDLFLVGAHIQGEPAHSFGLAVIPINGIANIDDNVVASGDYGAPLESPREIAVAPSGQYVFVANASLPYIYVFNVKLGFAPESPIPLMYGNNTWTLNITKYLADGGPYYSGLVKSFYSDLGRSSLSSVNWGGLRQQIWDVSENHHPIAISDSQGILYVLDNWTIPFNYQGTTAQDASAIWMLRAFTQNGVEVQIDGNLNDTLTYTGSSQNHNNVPTSSQQYSAIQSHVLYPPYGWPLSVNISTDWPTSKYGSSLPQHVTFCAVDCTNPGSDSGPNYVAYPPVGPAISGKGIVGPYPDDIGITTDYLGNIYLMAHVYTTEYSAWKHYLTLGYSSGKSNIASYAEMLILHPSIQNYTKTSDGSYSNFTCLISVSPTAPAPYAGGQQGTVLLGAIGTHPICNYAPSSVNLSNLYPPILSVPDSLKYLESLGSPDMYLNAPGLIGSFIPSGVASNTAEANSLFNNGVSGANSLDYNSLFNTPSTGRITKAPQTRTYLTSNIVGSVMVPYHIIYTVDQSWSVSSPGTVKLTLPPGGTNYNPPKLPCTYEQLIMQPACSFPNPSSSQQSVNLYTYQLVPLQNQGSLNETVEGGNLYVKDNIFSAPYQANLSDSGLIELPVQDYSLFADKIIGEIYINRTINATEFEATAGLNYLNYFTGGSITATSIPGLSQLASIFTSPKVINASNGYRYSIIPFLQVPINPLSTSFMSPGSIIPGYLTQVAIPYGSNPNATMVGANCGAFCDLGSISSATSMLSGFLNPYSAIDSVGGGKILLNALQGLTYYYSVLPAAIHIYSGPSNVTLNISNSTDYYDLYALFKRGSETYNLTLSLSGNDVLGYNRLLYTYVDRFNNTVLMPVDADFSNITDLQLNATTVIAPTNYNQTQVTVNGIATSVGLGGTRPLSGASIYLYYDANMNYLNTSMLSKIGVASLPAQAVQAACLASGTGISSVGSSLGIGQSPLANLQTLDPSYTKYATDCAYAVNSIGCVLANPLDCGSSNTLVDAAQLIESQPITYAPNYKSGSNSCIPPPNSLLSLPVYDCNIYGSPLPGAFQGTSIIGNLAGKLGIPQGHIIPTKDLPSYAIGPNGPMYCVPEFINGTGVFTSQLGMLAVAKTDPNGAFSYTFNACGTSQNKVIAEYYGSPPPQPLYGQQPNLAHSENSMLLQTSQYLQSSPEYNYYDSPNYTIVTFQNGSALLELGNIYAWAPIIIILILILAARASTGQGGSIFQYMGFASLTNFASGIGTGKVGRRLRSTDYGKRQGVIEPHSFEGLGANAKNIPKAAKKVREDASEKIKDARAGRAASALQNPLPEAGAITLASAAAVGRVNMTTKESMYKRFRGSVRNFNAEMGTYSNELASRHGAVTMGQFARNYRLDPARLKWVPRKNVRPVANPPHQENQENAITSTTPNAAAVPGHAPPNDVRPPQHPDDPYAVLGITSNATDNEVAKAFREKAKQTHPDMSSDPNASAKFAAVKRAYDNIREQRRRASGGSAGRT